MLKKELRLNHLKFRKELSSEVIPNYSLRIANNLLQLPVWKFDYYHLFLSITEKNEIDTSFIISILQGKDKNIVVPKVLDNRKLIHYLLTDNTTFRKNKWHIPEPEDGLEVPPNKIDVVFIPLLAFDELGYRVGYGKGYYDMFINECREDVLKIGLSLFKPVSKISDVQKHDLRMDYCITPEKVFTF
ncbi:5-formyltetrahydrofolate cyclo-ligase [uncultured Eudoraea sp.]|uniref:5-formyltetrahydrofolate cyclo-ligase n=1 Tax=uncultured Eudoraea sp. TaxID=1035614 RepID=UPI00260517AB|nr:5-formyltetrahydrofolate cyclo-ligase [uncultured Eudoraea sp.]